MVPINFYIEVYMIANSMSIIVPKKYLESMNLKDVLAAMFDEAMKC